jgi:hypothetical protein
MNDSACLSAQPSSHILRACHWSSGGTEFVFDDGTVLSFRNDMETFVAANNHTTSSQANGPDMLFTALCLSQYKAKVVQALDLYNRFTSSPRLVDGLTAKQPAAWTSSAPIDTMVLSDDVSLFEVHQGRATLSCAMRIVTMTLDASRETFHVRWPSPVYDTQGSAYMFMSSSAANSMPTLGPNFLASSSFLIGMKAIRFVWLEQTFCVAEAPEEWRAMLDRLLAHLDEADRTAAVDSLDHDKSASDDSDEEKKDITSGRRSISSSSSASSFARAALRKDPSLTPMRLPTGRRPTTTSLSCAEATTGARVLSACVPSSSGATIAFSPMQRVDAALMVASTALHNVSSHLHSGGSVVMWRFGADPTGRHPHSVCWNMQRGLSGEVLTPGRAGALVYEDSSFVEVWPMGQGYVVRHRRSRDNCREFHQAPDGSVALPSFVNAASAASKDEALARGRYLPEVGATLISLSQQNLLAPASSPQMMLRSTARDCAERFGDTPSKKAVEVVKCSSRIDHVGTFTALTNGVVRGHFDDRTILTLLPDANDTDDGLACTMVGRDATTTTVRAIHISSGHPMYPYLSYLLPFRRFQRLSESEQRLLGTTASFAGDSSGNQRSSSNLDPTQLQRRAMEETEAVLFRTKLAIDKSQEVASRSRALLST